MKEIGPSAQRKIGILLTYGQTIVSILVSLLYIPVMLQLLGKSEYGLYRTITSTVSVLSILDLGFGSSYLRFFSRYRQAGRYDKIKGLNGLFLTVFSVISVIALLCGIYLAFHLELVFSTGLTALEYQKARIMMLIVSANFALTYLINVPSAYIKTHERFIFLRGLAILQTLTGPFVQLPLLLYGFGSIGMVSVTLVVTILYGILVLFYARRYLRFQVSFQNWEPGLFKSVFFFSGLIALNIIVDQVNSSLDDVILGRFCGTLEVAINGVGASICSHYNQISTAISGVFAPQAHQLVAGSEQDSEQQKHVLTMFFTRIGRVQFLLLALVCSGFVFFGQAFIQLWAGPEYTQAYWVCLFRMLPATVPLIQNTGIEIQRAENRHHYRAYIYFAMAMLNIVMTVWLCQIYGAPGAAFATGLASLIAPGFIMNIVYHKKINIDMVFFWKNILRQLSGMVVPFAAGFVIMWLAPTDTWLGLAAFIALYAGIYGAFTWRFSMNSEEQGMILSIVRKVFSWSSHT